MRSPLPSHFPTTSVLLSLLLACTQTTHASPPIEAPLNIAQSVAARQKLKLRPLPEDTAEPAVPEIFRDETKDLGPQFIMAPVRRSSLFEAVADVQYFHTSNALLSENARRETNILFSTASFAFTPAPIAFGDTSLELRAGLREQLYNYSLSSTENQLNNLDFAVSTLFLGGSYQLPNHWSASLGIDYNRYLSAENRFTEFYTEALPQWALAKVIEINERNFITLSYVGAWHLTSTDPNPSPNINDRTDSVLLLASAHQLSDNLVLQPFYRIQHSHYWKNSDRNDLYNTLGLSLSFILNDWSSIRAFSTYETRDSSDPLIPDYRKCDTGLGLSVAIKF